MKTLMTNKIDPAKSTSKNFGWVIPGKGGNTSNNSITKTMEEKEDKFVKEGNFEHENYLGDLSMI